MPALQVASPAITLAKQAPPRTAAELFRAVERKADDKAESLSDSSSDSELEELRAEVRKFEKLVERKSRPVKAGGPGKIAVFNGKILGEDGKREGSSLDNYGLTMQVQRNIFSKEDAVQGDESNIYSRAGRPASAPMRSRVHANTQSGPRQGDSLHTLQEVVPPVPELDKYVWQAPSPNNKNPTKDGVASAWTERRVQTRSGLQEDTVKTWLVSFRLDDWLEELRDLGVKHLDDLQEIRDDDLSHMGMQVLQRRRFLQAVELLAPHGQTTGTQRVRPASAPRRIPMSARQIRDLASKEATFDEQRIMDTHQTSWESDDDGNDEFSVEDAMYKIDIVPGPKCSVPVDRTWIELHGYNGDCTDRIPLTLANIVSVCDLGPCCVEIEWPNLRRLQRLYIGSRCSDNDVSWQLDRVEVQFMTGKQGPVIFPCGAWIRKHNPICKLTPAPSNASSRLATGDYL
eukprot:COSAG05_NODE_851_length_6973_cov_6.213995_3_plen_458_part_00